MALSNPLGKFRTTRTPGGMLSRQALPSVTFLPGSIVVATIGSEYVGLPSSSAPNPDQIVLGFYEGKAKFASASTTDSGGGAVDATVTPNIPQMVQIRPGPIGNLSTGTGANQILSKHVDRPCFLYDDDTVYLTDLNGTLPFAGFVNHVDETSGVVEIRCDENTRNLFEVYTAAGLAPALPGATTQPLVARAVATNLAAGAFALGVFTATANGALATQDGVTLAVGDIIILPAGTLTTLVVSAANSGPYEVTSLGSGGAKVVLTRPARWQHAAVIAPETTISVGGEGTLYKGTRWYADPATATKVVGTDDPVLYPERVTQQVTLASSTVTITNVPIKSASKSNVLVTLATAGGTQTSTVAYGPIVAPTPGGIGTASLVVDAIASGQTKNGTADTSTINVTIFN